jgi:hypothetical protein
VVAQREFCEKEFVTAYLGIVELNPLEIEYVFQNINGIVECQFGSLREEFWFAHRIQHGSGVAVNIKIKSDYTLSALRKIRKGEELLFDYNRDVLCLTCKTETRLCNKFGTASELCSECNMKRKHGKSCSQSNAFF